MFQLYLTKHALIRMKERNVSEQRVKETVLMPSTWHYGENGEIIAEKKYGRKTILVVYLSEPKQIKVITVMQKG